MFRDQHPDRGSISIASDAVEQGWNDESATYSDRRYVRCSKCGFICHLDRDTRSTDGSRLGIGSTQPSTQLNGAVTAAATTITVDSTTGFPTPSSGSITALATTSQGTRVTSASHGLVNGTKIRITSTTNYNGLFYIDNVATNTFDIKGVYVADDATGTWYKLEYIYIHDAGVYSTVNDVATTYTAATGGPRVDSVGYTGKSSTTFTGCSDVLAHDDDMFVKGEIKVQGGCPFCSSYLYWGG